MVGTFVQRRVRIKKFNIFLVKGTTLHKKYVLFTIIDLLKLKHKSPHTTIGIRKSAV